MITVNSMTIINEINTSLSSRDIVDTYPFSLVTRESRWTSFFVPTRTGVAPICISSSPFLADLVRARARTGSGGGRERMEG